MNAEEYLKDKVSLDDWDRLHDDLKDSLWTNNVIGYMEGYAEAYHKEKMKEVGIKACVFQSVTNETSSSKCLNCGKEKWEHENL